MSDKRKLIYQRIKRMNEAIIGHKSYFVFLVILFGLVSILFDIIIAVFVVIFFLFLGYHLNFNLVTRLAILTLISSGIFLITNQRVLADIMAAYFYYFLVVILVFKLSGAYNFRKKLSFHNITSSTSQSLNHVVASFLNIKKREDKVTILRKEQVGPKITKFKPLERKNNILIIIINISIITIYFMVFGFKLPGVINYPQYLVLLFVLVLINILSFVDDYNERTNI